MRQSEIINLSGLKEVCEILFADQAQYKLQEYINSAKPKIDAVLKDCFDKQAS